MSPDFKRLLDAAERVGGPEYQYLFENDKEAIIRAVLTELRDVSVPMYRAGGTATVHSGPYGEYNIEVGGDAALAAFIDMIDCILTDAPSPETQSTAKAG